MLASATVDGIFRRMRARYGSTWDARWSGVPIEDVRADWARELSGVRPESIVYAMGYLPTDFPPTAAQFRATCMRAPEAVTPALPSPVADPQRVVGILRGLQARIKSNPHRAWMHRLRACAAAGEQLSAGQRHALRQTEHLDANSTTTEDA